MKEKTKVLEQLDIYRLKKKLPVRQLTKKDSWSMSTQTQLRSAHRHLSVGVPQRAGEAGRRGATDAVLHPFYHGPADARVGRSGAAPLAQQQRAEATLPPAW